MISYGAKSIAVLGALILIGAIAAEAAVMGSTIAGPKGAGSISFPLDSLVPNGKTLTADELETLNSSLRDNLTLTKGAKLETLRVDQNGPDHISGVADFTGATPGTQVQAILPDEVVRSLAAAFAAGSGGTFGGLVVPGLVAAGVVGGTVGGLAAAGVFDGGSSGGGSVNPPASAAPPLVVPTAVPPASNLQ